MQLSASHSIFRRTYIPGNKKSGREKLENYFCIIINA